MIVDDTKSLFSMVAFVKVPSSDQIQGKAGAEAETLGPCDHPGR